MPKAIISRKEPFPVVDIRTTAEFILSVQKKDGEIPWSVGGKTDPWDHVESAMGLTIGGFYEEQREVSTRSPGSTGTLGAEILEPPTTLE